MVIRGPEVHGAFDTYDDGVEAGVRLFGRGPFPLHHRRATPRDIFLEYIAERTQADGTDLGPKLQRLFQVLDTPEDKRQALLNAGQFDWTAMSPAIFGALFQSVMRPAEHLAARWRSRYCASCSAAMTKSSSN